jgi:hypothetical protein
MVLYGSVAEVSSSVTYPYLHRPFHFSADDENRACAAGHHVLCDRAENGF